MVWDWELWRTYIKRKSTWTERVSLIHLVLITIHFLYPFVVSSVCITSIFSTNPRMWGPVCGTSTDHTYQALFRMDQWYFVRTTVTWRTIAVLLPSFARATVLWRESVEWERCWQSECWYVNKMKFYCTFVWEVVFNSLGRKHYRCQNKPYGMKDCF